MSHVICRPKNVQNAIRCLPNAVETLPPLNSALCIENVCHTPYVDLTMHKMHVGDILSDMKMESNNRCVPNEKS